MNSRPAAGAQHPAQLAQRPGLVVDAAQDQRGHRHVEAVVVEGKVLGRRAQDPWRPAARCSLDGLRSRRRSIGGCGSVIVSDVTAGP